MPYPVITLTSSCTLCTKESRVLALDEFFVTDVADAMILSRLFGRLWDHGMILVATSNRAPDKLYENGLQRSLFMPFIHRLKVRKVYKDVIELDHPIFYVVTLTCTALLPTIHSLLLDRV